MATEPQYNASDMQVLEGLEAVRKRPGMYIGSTDSKGLNHLVWEIVDNSVDEALAGYASKITITAFPDNSVQVEDDGRGIPTDLNEKVGLTGVEIAYQKLHGGGKFGGSGYKSAGGLHGVGASVVNALSARLDVRVYRNKKEHDISFQRGVAGIWTGDDEHGKFTAKKGLTAKADKRSGEEKLARPTGTTVRWWYDRSIFLKDSEIDITAIHSRARQTAFLVPTLAIVVKDLRDSTAITEQTFEFSGGLVDMVEYVGLSEALHKPIHIKDTGKFTETVPVLDSKGHMVDTEVEREVEVDVAFSYNNGYESQIKSFVNVVNTPEGGTHVAGMEAAFTKVVLGNIKKAGRGLLKASEAPPIIDDIREGLTAVISIGLQEPQFIGQTKDKLGTNGVRKVVLDVVTENLQLFLDNKKNATVAKTIYQKVVDASRARLAARATKETARRKTSLESASMPSKLVDCAENGTEFAELHICEGDSALGTMKDARDPRYQALLPIRGKILNVQKATLKGMLDNAECASIIQVIGGGSGKSFDLSAMRYQNICIAVDADIDGAHIRTLLITFFWKYLRPLVEAGRLYASQPPLFTIKTLGKTKEILYLFSDEERDAAIIKLQKSGIKYEPVQRLKGLGEMDPDEFWDTTLDPEKRTLRRITVEDAVESERMLELAMGSKVEPRKDWIMDSRSRIDENDLDV
jgi:DNA gyrase subunit B